MELVTGSDFDLSVNPDYTRNIKFKTGVIFRNVRFELSRCWFICVNNGSNGDAAPMVVTALGCGHIYANISTVFLT
jgi:hypothetical protein